MGIIYDETGRVFKLDTLHTSYMMGIADEEGFLGHIYYGKRISSCDVSYLLRIQEPPLCALQKQRGQDFLPGCLSRGISHPRNRGFQGGGIENPDTGEGIRHAH